MTGKRPAALGLALATVLFLGACSKMAANSVLADALFSQNTLELPIVQEACGAENVREYSDYDSGSRLHIHIPGEDSKADDYLLSKHWGGDGKLNYTFSGMGAVIEYGTEDENPTFCCPTISSQIPASHAPSRRSCTPGRNMKLSSDRMNTISPQPATPTAPQSGWMSFARSMKPPAGMRRRNRRISLPSQRMAAPSPLPSPPTPVRFSFPWHEGGRS